VSLDEDEHTRDGSATSTTKLTLFHSIQFALHLFRSAQAVIVLLDYFAYDEYQTSKKSDDYSQFGTNYVPARHKYSNSPAVMSVHFEKPFSGTTAVFAQVSEPALYFSFRFLPRLKKTLTHSHTHSLTHSYSKNAQLFCNYSTSFSFVTTVSSVSNTSVELLVQCTNCINEQYWKEDLQLNWRVWPKTVVVDVPTNNGTDYNRTISNGGFPYHEISYLGPSDSQNVAVSIHAISYNDPNFLDPNFFYPPGMLVMPYLGVNAAEYGEYDLSFAQTAGVSVYDNTEQFSVISLHFDDTSGSTKGWHNGLKVAWFTWNGTDTDCPKEVSCYI